ncbi:MAG: sugar kinase [Actinobacteria bacterium BACL2 MAG-121001-bin67]|jgi:2-dehydro-3-deoxygluconokinase|uniref:Sugar kinase n=3 Tax=ac1 cluster TaxID=1655545 RepID=A0A0R2PBA0_9ACTN|nr:MAG: sugar kinase [Actinobacteria bacterium BACL2 MAG-121001-bin67]KRO54090.1 MAG: sugar kinase [Actinobacteria bacterium BACL2 MAG-120820-bin50]KRO59982.1 MAG: sugar kinase [Pelagibacteraceae bacterium BACL5 MAG-120705-bin12]KRO74544.1 MAG: sugar kinase [Actinobacteria bacterium BACL2 MAG-120920-bin34]KRP31385.1 MAG: sugar kinase [Actinobacteria bacterium BACL2 MAG-120507-bin38]HCP72379.1 sugar kinase [Actinomycetota bacterium]
MKIKESGRFDLVSLGEVMLRLDPGNTRVRTSRSFNVWEGGGEYNVARGLRKCFGKKTSILTALADNEVGRLIEDLILQGGVNTDHLIWREYDGVGRSVRNGLNFTERGFGVRGAVGVSDRGRTAVSQLTSKDFDWEEIFEKEGSRWLHTGGIFAALSESTAEVALEAVRSARKSGAKVSYDLNYRPSLWKSIGGREKAQEVNQKLAAEVDVLIGNEEDFEASLGIELEGSNQSYQGLNLDSYKKMVERAVQIYPNLELIAVTLREVKSASRNDWSAIAWSKESGLLAGRKYEDLEIFDRVGGGDSFASGLIYGLLEGLTLEKSLSIGLAHGALAMTTPGDTSMATLAEVLKLAEGGSARVQR